MRTAGLNHKLYNTQKYAGEIALIKKMEEAFSGYDIVFDGNKDSFIVTSRRRGGRITKIGASNIDDTFQPSDVLEILKNFDFKSDIILNNDSASSFSSSNSSSSNSGSNSNLYNLRAVRVPDGKIGIGLKPCLDSRRSDNDDESDGDLLTHRPCKGLLITGIASKNSAYNSCSSSSYISSSGSGSASSSSSNSASSEGKSNLIGFCLDAGDKIMSVNGISITELTAEAAVTLLDSSTNRLLLVMKDRNNSNSWGGGKSGGGGGGEKSNSLSSNSKLKLKKRKSDPSSIENEDNEDNEHNEHNEHNSDFSREYRRIRGKLVEHYLRKKHKSDLIVDPLSSVGNSSSNINNNCNSSKSSTPWTSLSRNYSKKYNNSLYDNL